MKLSIKYFFGARDFVDFDVCWSSESSSTFEGRTNKHKHRVVGQLSTARES